MRVTVGDGRRRAHPRAVDGGWRIAVPVTTAGPYRIAVTCSAVPTTATTTTTDGPLLPITGGPLEVRAIVALALLAAAAGARRLLPR